MNPPAERKISRLGLTLLLCFFFGFPFAGIMYFWNDMHKKIESNSAVQGKSLAEESLAGSMEEVKKLCSKAFSKELDKSFFAVDRPALGRFLKLGEHHPIKSWASERDDQMWQFVRYRGKASFASGERELEWVVTRLYINPDWHLDDMKLVQEGSTK